MGRLRVNQTAIAGFLIENYKVIIFYVLFAFGLFFFFYGLMRFFPGGGRAPGFFQSLDEQYRRRNDCSPEMARI
jgi:hypothetical protein